ncbi:unnamed protein product, partial [Callosobruchus maculatus]
MIAEKRRARSTWQRTHSPEDRRKYTQISNKLKSELRKKNNESYERYILTLSRQDSSIWKPIKNKRRPVLTSSPIRRYSTPPGPW